jgi:archaetidylinositol phosphate synthase
MISKHKNKMEGIRFIIAKPFLRIHPHILSVFAIYFVILFFISLVAGKYAIALFAFFGTAFDMIDGTVARATGKVTMFGEFLDASLDRVSDALIFSAFGFAGLIPWELLIALLIVNYLISYMSARAGEAGKGSIKLTAGIIERPERWFFVLASVLMIIFFPCRPFYGITPTIAIFSILLFLSVITVIQRFIKAYQLLQ